MKLSHYPTQSNTPADALMIVNAGENLIGKEGCLVKLTHDTGVPEVVLPNDVADEADYLLLEGGADGTKVTVVAVGRDRPVRIRLNGTCNPGDKLTLAAIDGTHDGHVRTLPADADTYWLGFRAEEKGADGQLVLARLLPNPGPVTVT